MKLQEKSRYINDLFYDLKAEYVVSCLSKEGSRQHDLLAVFDGPMKRKWSTDIDRCEVESFENGDESLNLHLNRAGLYDALPEALLHLFLVTRDASGTEMAKDSMRLKIEEKQARRFFRIFENEIFWLGVRSVINENEEYCSLNSDYLNGLIPGFWKTDEKIAPDYISKLIKFLPWAHQIAGDYNLTALCLESIIREKVCLEIDVGEPEDADKQDSATQEKSGYLGRSQLGKDMILGQKTAGFSCRLSVRIGPLKNLNAKEFFKSDSINRLLKCFYSYFIPAELDVETHLVTFREQNAFILSSDNEAEKAILGYNVVL